MLFGSKCGGEAFGQSWHIAKRRMEGLAERQWELSRLDRFDTIRSELKSSLEVWRRLIPAVIGRKSAFTMKLSELTSRLMEARNLHDGHFFVKIVTFKIHTEAALRSSPIERDGRALVAGEDGATPI
jgi:hypothetical protein